MLLATTISQYCLKKTTFTYESEYNLHLYLYIKSFFFLRMEGVELSHTDQLLVPDQHF